MSHGGKCCKEEWVQNRADPLAVAKTGVAAYTGIGRGRGLRPEHHYKTGISTRCPLRAETGLQTDSDGHDGADGTQNNVTSVPRMLSETARLIEQALEALLPLPHGPEARLLEAMRYATLGGGKRLRGFLAVEVASLFGVSETCAARVAASVEMLHAYSLVHDDLPAMDDDDLRRGKPSCHKAFDEATAILAGDALQTRAFEVLAEEDTHSDPLVRADLVQALAAAAGPLGMVGGQMIDMLAEGKTLNAEEVARLHALKTGRLIRYSAEAGAILGRAPAAVRQSVAAFGRDLGAAFQIADDVLDVTGSAAELGKTAGKDIAVGKATLVSLIGVERARRQAEMLAEQAVAHLEYFGDRAERLAALAGFVVSRRS